MQDTMTAVVQDEYGTDPDVVLGIEQQDHAVGGIDQCLAATGGQHARLGECGRLRIDEDRQDKRENAEQFLQQDGHGLPFVGG